MTSRMIGGLREVADELDVFLLDQYGVLHNGQSPFPGVVDCLRRLRGAGKAIAVVSNSGKRSDENRARLRRLGFSETLFDAVVTSGELCHHLLRRRLDSGALPRGARCLVLSRDGDLSPLQDLAIAVTPVPEEADFILIAGIESERVDLADYEARLAPLAARGVPCLCSNPDLRMYTNGGVSPGPGALARAYAAKGGEVTWIGKPHPEIFRFALAELGAEDPARAVMIGDSPEHDVAGARSVGSASLFVTGGLYGGHEFQPAEGNETTAAKQDFIMKALAW